MKKQIFLSILFVSLSTLAADKAEKPKHVQPTMHKLFSKIQELVPYVVDEEKFNDPKNEKFIADSLKEMKKLAKDASHAEELKTTTFKISRKVLEDHFADIERVFKVGNKNFARWELGSTVPLCMSCHTQAPSASRNWDVVDITRGNLNDYQKAELLFMGRDFDDALNYYDVVISGYPDNKIPVNQVEKSLERKVVIFSRVKRDFTGGVKSLEKSLKNKKLPEAFVKNVNAWIGLFRIQNKNGFPNPKKSNDRDIQKYVQKELKRGLWDDMTDARNTTNPRLVKNLTVSGVLYEYLNTHPETKIKPDILLWLAMCDRKFQETLFYSLADMYLKECINEFPTHPTAKKCFDEYKDNTIISYSGSGGVNLPDDVKKELKDLSIKVYGVDKSQVEGESTDENE